ncbi:MAG TPA: cyanophycin synthetase, partial [Pirellulales bacterium]|nr:cyanophycin synthetase [Pirellulales bacterium]
AKIAGEKAGIIKSHTPVVSGVVEPEPRAVIERTAGELGCPLVQWDRDFAFDYRPPRHLERAMARGAVDYRRLTGDRPSEMLNLELKLVGRHQAANAAVALATLEELARLGWPVSEAATRAGLSQVCWPARIEVLGRRPTVVLDSAHNTASIEALVRTLDESFEPGPRLLVFATTRDKDVDGMLRILAGKFDEVIFTRYWDNPRGVPPEELQAMAAQLSPVTTHVAADAESGWQLALKLATPGHLICITGSFFLAAEIGRAIQRVAR